MCSLECGHGACVNVTTTTPIVEAMCVCEEGFTNIYDMSYSPSTPCDKFLPVLRAEWGITLVFECVAVLASIWGLSVRIRARMIRRATWRLWMVPVLTVYTAAMFIPLALGKIIAPLDFIVGISVSATVLYCLGSAGAWTTMLLGAWGLIRAQIMQSLGKGRGGGQSVEAGRFMNYRGKVKMLERFLLLIGALNIGWSFAPLLLLADRSFDRKMLAARLHGLGLGASMVVLGCVLLPLFLTPLIREMEQTLANVARLQRGLENGREEGSTDDDQLRRVVRKLRISRAIVIQQGLFQFALACFFSIPAYFVEKVGYNFPIAWTTAALMSTLLIWVTTTTRSPKSSSILASDGTKGAKGEKARSGDEVPVVVHNAQIAPRGA